MSQPAVDSKAYYSYLFQANKKPTEVLDALLRGIANYIKESIGDTSEKELTPPKLASFYKSVGGNYDSLFVDVPHPSISWIYASIIRCQHTLQPTPDDFNPPTIPALTTRGYVRWQSIEILLGPEEHVPFIQNAVRTFGIKHPDTGESFPVDLPKEAFPLIPDKEIERWHTECALKLRERATPDADHVSMRPDLPPRPKVQTGYTHVRSRTRDDYFDEPRSRPPTRPISYAHVPVATTGRPARPKMSRSPTHRSRQYLAPEEPVSPRTSRARRRSLPENVTSPQPPQAVPVDTPMRPPQRPPHPRGHSHPRHHARRGSVSSDASSEGDTPVERGGREGDRTRRPLYPRAHGTRVDDDPNAVRFAPSAPTPPEPRRRVGRSGERRDRDKEAERRNTPIPIDISGKLSTPFVLGRRDREKEKEKEKNARSSSRSAGKVSWKDLGDVTEFWRRSSKDSSQDEGHHSGHSRHRSDRGGEDRADYKRRERERDRDRDSYRDRDRDRPRDVERPRIQSQKGSHEDLWKRDRDRDRERETVGRGGSIREAHADRERGYSDRERGHSPVRGVDGRRYPSHG